MAHYGVVSFALGLAAAMLIGAGLKVIFGIKLNLYLLNTDSTIGDQSVVPLTAELKKGSWWRTLRQKKWREDLEITLMDYNGHAFTYKIKYHLWNGFYLKLKSASGDTTLDALPMITGKNYFLKTGMELFPGDRKFTVLITTAPLEKVVRL
jgi:hypothetical protein